MTRYSPCFSRRRLRFALVLLCLLAPSLSRAAPAATAPEKSPEPLTFIDLMKFRTIRGPVISRDGAWVAYEASPDRGDGEVLVRSAVAGGQEHSIERGTGPVISADSRWVAALVEPPLAEREKAAGKKGKDKPQRSLTLLSTVDGSTHRWEGVEAFTFSEDGRWLAVHLAPEKKAQGGESDGGELAAEATSGAAEATSGEPSREVEGSEPSSGELTAAAEPASAEPAGEEVGPVTEESAPLAEMPTGPEVEMPAAEEPGEVPPEEEPAAPEAADKKGEDRLGSTLVLRHLESGREWRISHVESFAFDTVEGASRYLAWVVAGPEGTGNGVYLHALEGLASPGAEDGLGDARPLHAAERGRVTGLAWAEEARHLAFAAAVDDEEGHPGHAGVWIWEPGSSRGVNSAREVAASSGAPEGWYVPIANALRWSRDGERLFFGYKPLDQELPKPENDEEEEAFDPYDVEAILEEATVDVWHGDDPYIKPHERQRWKDEKDRVYTAVYHRDTGEVVPLADLRVERVDPTDNPHAALGYRDHDYRKAITWGGYYFDVYLVDLRSGAKHLVAEELDNFPSLSPDGRRVAFYRSPHWYLYAADAGEQGAVRNLTAELEVSFADEENDRPNPPEAYGAAGWLEDSSTFLAHDRYDLWALPASSASSGDQVQLLDLTAGFGREHGYRLRWVDVDPDEDFVQRGRPLFLTGYHEDDKTWGLFEAPLPGSGQPPAARSLLAGEKVFTFLAKAEAADRILFTRESYTEFPDLRVGTWPSTEPPDLSAAVKISDVNPRVADYGWGTAEKVEWTSADGVPLDGVLIKPPGYQPGERVPVLVYFYRFFSQRLHQFNEPVVNHRPSFPVYASDGYAVFLPDIPFEVGRPGLSAVKSLVPGVQKLVDMGVADPNAIGLHGHSWSGYQAAFVITQTDIFAAAVAGAPVSNMTSAYSGIRWGSGLARQFQYERGQSRMGKTLWENRDVYIENSPVFYADRIQTPLLIQFGDEDGAVPWYQGIELYLALRRLDKDVIFLQYRGEDHHLKSYGNKLDYSIKMKQYFDHYLKGEPAPAWMTEGVPYRGE